MDSILVFTLYLFQVILCTGYFNAAWKCEVGKTQDDRNEGIFISIALSVAFAIIPFVGPLVVYFITGMGKHGWDTDIKTSTYKGS